MKVLACPEDDADKMAALVVQSNQSFDAIWSGKSAPMSALDIAMHSTINHLLSLLMSLRVKSI